MLCPLVNDAFYSRAALGLGVVAPDAVADVDAHEINQKLGRIKMLGALETDAAKVTDDVFARPVVRHTRAAREQQHVVHLGERGAPRLVQRAHYARVFAFRELDQLLHHLIRLKCIEPRRRLVHEHD